MSLFSHEAERSRLSPAGPPPAVRLRSCQRTRSLRVSLHERLCQTQLFWDTLTRLLRLLLSSVTSDSCLLYFWLIMMLSNQSHESFNIVGDQKEQSAHADFSVLGLMSERRLGRQSVSGKTSFSELLWKRYTNNNLKYLILWDAAVSRVDLYHLW